MTTPLKLLVGGIGLGALLVFGFLWKHDADARREGQIAMLDSTRKVQAATIDSLTKKSQLDDHLLAQAVESVTVTQVKWKAHSDTVPKLVDRILHDTVTDSAKVLSLAALVLVTKAKGDTLSRSVDSLKAATVSLRADFQKERDGWSAERTTAANEIRLLKKQSRHWGLVGYLGYGAAKLPDGTIRATPQLGLGLGYRY